MGMLVMDRIEGAAYPPQLSVRTAAQRKGFGRRLPAYAIEWAAKEELWLTTCRDVPWTRPFYERHGFVADRLRRRSGKKPDARGAARSIR
jgi:GNAT superfamily N-acetyltransferase